MDFYKKASRVFKLDEGDGPPNKEGYPYKDSQGLWTIGRGHLIGERLENLRLSPEMIEYLFIEDLAKAINDARFCVGYDLFDSLNEARKMALVSLLFTLGRTKFLKFEETILAIKRMDWDEVSRRLLNTKWAADVDPKRRRDEGRDDRIAYMFKTGRFHPDYGLGG